MTDREHVFDLLKKDMDHAMDSLRYGLNQNLDVAHEPAVFVPPSRRVRLMRAVLLVRGYLWTLWRALKGDDLDTPYEGDD